MGIRDAWDSPTAPVNESLKTLSDLVGYECSITPEWGMLWAELQPHFPDIGTFVPEIASVVKLWADTLTARLNDDRNSEWTDTLLEEVGKTQRIKVLLEVCVVSALVTSFLAG
jgi:hypothetical protein